MKKTILNFLLVLGLSFLTLSCQKDEDSSATSAIVGVWSFTETFSNTYDGVTSIEKYINTLVINEGNTYSYKNDLYIDGLFKETFSETGTYSYDKTSMYLTVNYTYNDEIHVYIYKVLSISNSQMKMKDENDKILTWTKK